MRMVHTANSWASIQLIHEPVRCWIATRSVDRLHPKLNSRFDHRVQRAARQAYPLNSIRQSQQTISSFLGQKPKSVF